MRPTRTRCRISTGQCEQLSVAGEDERGDVVLDAVLSDSCSDGGNELLGGAVIQLSEPVQGRQRAVVEVEDAVAADDQRIAWLQEYRRGCALQRPGVQPEGRSLERSSRGADEPTGMSIAMP